MGNGRVTILGRAAKYKGNDGYGGFAALREEQWLAGWPARRNNAESRQRADHIYRCMARSQDHGERREMDGQDQCCGHALAQYSHWRGSIGAARSSWDGLHSREFVEAAANHFPAKRDERRAGRRL